MEGMEVKHTLHLGNILGPLIRILKNTFKFSLEGKKKNLFKVNIKLY